MPAFKAEKLRVNLRLAINRLKLLEKKKSEWHLIIRRSARHMFVVCSEIEMIALYLRSIVTHTRPTP